MKAQGPVAHANVVPPVHVAFSPTSVRVMPRTLAGGGLDWTDCAPEDGDARQTARCVQLSAKVPKSTFVRRVACVMAASNTKGARPPLSHSRAPGATPQAHPAHSSVRVSPHMKLRERADPKIAILFDCDGVIVETEELHRLAYNKSFVDSGLQIQGQQVTASTTRHSRVHPPCTSLEASSVRRSSELSGCCSPKLKQNHPRGGGAGGLGGGVL